VDFFVFHLIHGVIAYKIEGLYASVPGAFEFLLLFLWLAGLDFWQVTHFSSGKYGDFN
jgi:hypothetical protein